MGNMANEMQARMREDGIDTRTGVTPAEPNDGRFGSDEIPATDMPGGPSTGAVPSGAEGYPPTPSAGMSNTDTSEPGPVPYSRFREVNEQLQSLRGYSQLHELGYDPDSLGRLASFEARYVQDPLGTMGLLVDDLDLPQEQKDAISQALTAANGVAPEQGADNADDGSVRSSLSPEDRALLDRARQREEQEMAVAQTRQREEILNGIVSAWKNMDQQDGIRSPSDGMIHSLVSTVLTSGQQQFQNADQVATAAREVWMREREASLGEIVQASGRRTGAPSALLGSAPGASPPQTPRTMREANQLARAAFERGELPPLE